MITLPPGTWIVVCDAKLAERIRRAAPESLARSRDGNVKVVAAVTLQIAGLPDVIPFANGHRFE